MVRFGLSFSLRETLGLAGGSVLGSVCSLWGQYGTQRRFQVPGHRRSGGDTEQSQESRGGGLVRATVQHSGPGALGREDLESLSAVPAELTAEILLHREKWWPQGEPVPRGSEKGRGGVDGGSWVG